MKPWISVARIIQYDIGTDQRSGLFADQDDLDDEDIDELETILRRFDEGRANHTDVGKVLQGRDRLRSRAGTVLKAASPKKARRSGGPGSAPSSPKLDKDRARAVNTRVVKAGSKAGVKTSLQVGTAYEVLLQIGKYLPDSLLSQDEAEFPEESLPDGDLKLRAVLAIKGAAAVTQSFTLPAEGPSFACDCAVNDGPHPDSCTRIPWVRLPVTVSSGAKTVVAELLIYFGVVCVHIQRITMPIGTSKEGPTAIRKFVLTHTFEELAFIDDRELSVVNSSTSQVVVNGLGFLGAPISLDGAQANTSALITRKVLSEAQFENWTPEADPKELESRYVDGLSKDLPDFKLDLAQLAMRGSDAYAGVFGDRRSLDLKALLAHEEDAREDPPVIQIVDSEYPASIVWAAIYDIPMGPDPEQYTYCESVATYGPDGNGGVIPVSCPFGDHSGTTDLVCLWGFWGLSSFLEQPGSVSNSKMLTQEVTNQDVGFSYLMIVGDETGLDDSRIDQHIKSLASAHAGSAPDLRGEGDLASALAPETMDVIYTFSHCMWESPAPGAQPVTFLRMKGDSGSKVYDLYPSSLRKWGVKWGKQHWSNRRPIVIMNGCHTTVSYAGTQNTFVEALEAAGASGVIGTEILMDQAIATFVGETLIDEIAGGRSVGQALHAMRWKLVRSGNVMGLAYTPYCLASLTIRPQANP